MLTIKSTTRKGRGAHVPPTREPMEPISQLLQLFHQGTYKYLKANYYEGSHKQKKCQEYILPPENGLVAHGPPTRESREPFSQLLQLAHQRTFKYLKPIIMKGHLNEKCQEYILSPGNGVVTHVPPTMEPMEPISQLLQLVHQGTYKYFKTNYYEGSPKGKFLGIHLTK